jgi:acetolactate synthase small subunit
MSTSESNSSTSAKQNYTIEISSDNNFSVLGRIINVLNRRQVRIRNLIACEDPNDHRRGSAIVYVYAQQAMMEHLKKQLEKLIEVDTVHYFETSVPSKDYLVSQQIRFAQPA